MTHLRRKRRKGEHRGEEHQSNGKRGLEANNTKNKKSPAI